MQLVTGTKAADWWEELRCRCSQGRGNSCCLQTHSQQLKANQRDCKRVEMDRAVWRLTLKGPVSKVLLDLWFLYCLKRNILHKNTLSVFLRYNKSNLVVPTHGTVLIKIRIYIEQRVLFLVSCHLTISIPFFKEARYSRKITWLRPQKISHTGP